MKHVWMDVAPEVTDDAAEGEMWRWCERCGCMSLAKTMYFVPGDPKHKNGIMAHRDLEPPCNT